MGLTAKQRIFVKEYLVDKNAARAAREAGYSQKAARQVAQRLLTKTDIADAIEAGLAKQADKAGMNAERLIARLEQIAFKFKHAKNSDRIRAIDLLGRRFRIFVEAVEVTGRDGGPQVVLTMAANGTEKKDDGDSK